MRKVLGWMAVMVLCCAASAAAGEPPPDARLQEAQRAYDEAMRLNDEGKYAEGVTQAEHALALREAVLGSTHPAAADCLNLLGELRMAQEDFAQAESLLQRALTLREAALGQNHPNVADSLDDLGLLYYEQGLYGRAEPPYQRALAIREAVLGKNHPEVATSLNNLAVLYYSQGSYDRAELLYVRSIAINEAALGKDHPEVANALNNLALVYFDQGAYGRAEPLYLRALAIREATLGKDHPVVATTLQNLAVLYQQQGAYDRAEPLFLRALAIREAALGPRHSVVATTLNNLASLYREQGAYDRAEPLALRALAIKEAALGRNHPKLATYLNNLALLYQQQGAYGRAEPLYLRALAIAKTGLGQNHPDVATSLNNLADLYSVQGLHGRAEPFLLRALAIRETALGENHPRVASSLNSLALLRLAQHRLGKALPLFTRAFAISELRLRHEALDFSEARLTRLLQLLRKDEERLYALLRAHPDNARVRSLALSASLLLKGRTVEETADISRAVYRSLDAQEHDTFERLRGLRSQLAQLSLRGPGSLPPAAYQQQLSSLASQGDALEAELAQRSAPLRALTALPSPADVVSRVAQGLPKDAALVEFISSESPALPGSATSPSGPRYQALVLFPDATTRAVDLGPAEPIDSAASSLRTALANRDPAFQAQAQALYQLAFRPLLPLLGKTRHLFLSPDGQLALVPFAALHDGQQFLVEAYDFVYLTSGKDLLPRPQEAAPASSVVVVADPDFGAPLQPTVASADTASAPAARSASIEHFFSSLREDSTHRAWAAVPLPGTRKEAEAIHRLLPQAQLYLGAEATKQRLMRLSTPGVLHLATHGFFLEDAPVPEGSRSLVHFGALGEEPSGLLPPDPLLRSGLLLAGASALMGATSGSPDNVLVTALELAGLDLWGTQLVVLSACDTGRGDVKTGQGVYGLRRAFIVAGAETVVTSLWKVDDETTSALMEAYYRNLLAGQGRASALREAMRALRKTQPHPHYWAPFIVLGRDTPLQGLTPNPSGRAQ